MADGSGGPPSGGGGGGVNESLSSSINEMGKLTSMAQTLREIFAKMPDSLKESDSNLRMMRDTLEDSIDSWDEIKDQMESIKSLSVSARKSLYDNTSAKEAKKTLEVLLKSVEKMNKNYASGTKEFAKTQKEADKLKQILGEINEEQSLSESQIKKINSIYSDIARNTEKIKNNIKSSDLSHISKQATHISKVLSHIGLGGSVGKHTERGTKMREASTSLSNERIQRNISRGKEKEAAVIEEFKKQDPNFDVSKSRAKIADKIFGMGNKKAKQHYIDEEIGEAFKHGTGGLGTGLSKMSGFLEGGLGGLGTAMEVGGPVLAGLALVKEGFDKAVKQNKEMESSLGKAGLFSGEGAGFLQARDNLTPNNWGYSKLGLSFERNLKIAQAMQEGGLGVRELVTGEGGREGEFGPGGFGKFQRVAVGSGRLAGMTDSEGVQQTIKLIKEYRKTINGVDDFFLKVAKSSAAAGISTTKYISVIDEINSHFDRMNKSLDTTLNFLTQMGKSGKVGADDLKSYLELLTGGAPKSLGDVGKTSFMMDQMDPKVKKAMMEGFENRVGRAIDSLGGDKGDLTSTSSVEDIQAARYKWNTGKAQTLSPEDRAAEGKKWQELIQAAVANKSMHSGSSIEQATALLTGSTPESQATMNITKLSSAAKLAGISSDSLMGDPAKFMSSPLVQGYLEAFGMKASDKSEALQMLSQSGQGFLEDATKSLSGGTLSEKKKAVETARAFLREMKAKKFTVGINQESLDKVLKSDDSDEMLRFMEANGVELAKNASKTTSVLDYLLSSFQKPTEGEDKDKAMEKARQVGMQTQTTADMIANAFSTWFNDLISITGRIFGLMSKETEETRARERVQYIPFLTFHIPKRIPKKLRLALDGTGR